MNTTEEIMKDQHCLLDALAKGLVPPLWTINKKKKAPKIFFLL